MSIDRRKLMSGCFAGFVVGGAAQAGAMPAFRGLTGVSRPERLAVPANYTAAKRHQIRAHKDLIHRVHLFANGKRAVSFGSDRYVKHWDLETGKELGRFETKGDTSVPIGILEHRDAVIALGPTGKASWSSRFSLWSLSTGEQLLKSIPLIDIQNGKRFEIDTSRRIYVSDDNRHALVTGSPETHLVDLNRFEVIGRKTNAKFLEALFRANTRRKVSGDLSTVLAENDKNELEVWDIKTEKRRHILSGHAGSPNSHSISADGRFATSTSHINYKDEVVVWDLQAGKEVFRTLSLEGVAYAWAGDNGKLGFGADSEGAKLFDLSTGKPVADLTGHTSTAYAVHLREDINMALSAGSDGNMFVWDIKST
ncbi:MAG: hypothetical protein MPJ78_04725 [Hyphomicrobiaceae bacterium]|nr:hypothetical protein [Hyphomicrobiaceae bacterium]